ncbi:MAG: T9SS type A sorting domain-containing protein, partial [Bdellovibrionales bacterium]
VELAGEERSNLSLFDLHGNLISSIYTTSNIAQFSLQSQPPGIYFLQVETAGVVKTLPVLKK